MKTIKVSYPKDLTLEEALARQAQAKISGTIDAVEDAAKMVKAVKERIRREKIKELQAEGRAKHAVEEAPVVVPVVVPVVAPVASPAKKAAPAKKVPTAKTKEAEPVAVSAADFLMFVGGSFYTKEDFIKEASEQGISKRLPSWRLSPDMVVGESKVWLAVGGTRKGESSKVFGYFVPTAVQFVAGPDGEKEFAEVCAYIRKTKGGEVILHDPAVKEKPRKCGTRKIGGAYFTAAPDKDGSPLVLLDREIDYKGNHFRGLMRLSADHAQALRNGNEVVTLVPEVCMACSVEMLTAPDGAMRAARERRRMEKGEAPKWMLLCGDCLKAKREAEREAEREARAAGAEEVAGDEEGASEE